MPELCFITTCMGRLAHLQQTLGHTLAQPQASCIVVDYSCPQQCGEWVERAYPQVKVVRHPGQTRFHLNRARNLGARAADAPWLCFVDADVALDPAFSAVVRPLLRPGCFYVAEPWSKGLGGAFLCSRADFDRCGGYDEVFQGWGWEDFELYARLRLLGARQGGFPASLVRQLAHGDDLRAQFYDTRDLALSGAINRLYMNAKIDLMKLTEQALPLEGRQQLYAGIDGLVRQALDTGEEVNLVLDVRRMDLASGRQCTVKLAYVVHPRP